MSDAFTAGISKSLNILNTAFEESVLQLASTPWRARWPRKNQRIKKKRDVFGLSVRSRMALLCCEENVSEQVFDFSQTVETWERDGNPISEMDQARQSVQRACIFFLLGYFDAKQCNWSARNYLASIVGNDVNERVEANACCALRKAWTIIKLYRHD